MTSPYPHLAPNSPIYAGQQGISAQQKPPRRIGVTAAIVGAAAIALTAGAIGGFIGNHMATGTAPAVAAPAAAPAPTAEQVHAATVDLCTRFAAGYRAMPSPQKSGFDVIPTINYISEALRDNAAADGTIRDAVTESLRLARDQASNFSDEPAKGAIQTNTNWTPKTANAVDQRVWDLCRAYGG